MKASEISGLDSAELARRMRETHEQLFRLRFQMGMGQTEGLKKYRVLRKDRARLLTVMRAKGMNPVTAAAPVVVTTGKDKKKKK